MQNGYELSVLEIIKYKCCNYLCSAAFVAEIYSSHYHHSIHKICGQAYGQRRQNPETLSLDDRCSVIKQLNSSDNSSDTAGKMVSTACRGTARACLVQEPARLQTPRARRSPPAHGRSREKKRAGEQSTSCRSSRRIVRWPAQRAVAVHRNADSRNS